MFKSGEGITLIFGSSSDLSEVVERDFVDWTKPVDVESSSVAVEELIPCAADIPDEFYDPENYWVVIFVDGLHPGFSRGTLFSPKADVDQALALRHLRTVVGSSISYGHKEAACAYLMSLWFDAIALPPPSR